MKLLALLVAALVTLTGCTHDRKKLGSAENPVKIFFVPSVDQQFLEDTSKALKIYMESHTPYKYKISIPANYIAAVEAFGTGRADIASLNTYGYVLAHDKYGAEAKLITIRFGERTYKAQYLARADGKIKTLKDIDGKKMAFVDPSSVSGYLLPMKYLNDRGIHPKQTVFAMRHDNVVSMVYQKQVDVGVTFWSPPAEGKIQDARRLVIQQFPDVEQKIKIVALSSDIPNDPIVFRKDLPKEMEDKIIPAFIAFAQTPEGLKVLKQLSSVTGFETITDAIYDETRQAIKQLGGEQKGAAP